jgi:hypothetical protein
MFTQGTIPGNKAEEGVVCWSWTMTGELSSPPLSSCRVESSKAAECEDGQTVI